MTHGREQTKTLPATQEDVQSGAAKTVGQPITKILREEPTGVYFEKVVPSHPANPHSPVEGQGQFRFQLWLIGLTGIDLTTVSSAGLSALSFIFDIVFPFVALFAVSLFTEPNSERVLREFYARVHTPALADQERDAIEVQMRIDDPDLVERDKMFPGTNWEFWKLTRADVIGFSLCWVGVAAIIGLYLLITNIGS